MKSDKPKFEDRANNVGGSFWHGRKQRQNGYYQGRHGDRMCIVRPEEQSVRFGVLENC